MADYKNEQWWVELQKSLEGFGDSKMSDSDLGRWNGAKIGGRKGGTTNAKSGHMKEIQKKAASLGGKVQGKIQGKINVENKFWENLTFEQRSKGGKIAGKKRTEMPDFHQHLCNMGKKSGELKTKIKLEKFKLILKFIRKTEFTYSDMRNACEKFGITGDRIAGQAKKILREKSLVKQIHKGYNQFDPSLYVKIK
jgi:hypothetical protein